MHKHTLSVPLVPASAPTSPATVRLNRTEREFRSPVTPQRVIRPQKTAYRSPLTPASTYSSPYTPLSLRSFSTASNSTLNTPGSATSFKTFPVVHSPEIGTAVTLTDKSIADIAVNWRSRANENGIKVTTADDSSFGDDEASDLTPSDVNSTAFANEEVLFPPPFLSTHRRSRTQSSFYPTCAAAPHVQRTPARRTLGILNTPPPKPTTSSQLKVKGSFTDPAHTRRRPSFGQISTELFDIDENAFEPYPQSFSSPAQSLVLQDPFNGSGLTTIAESIPQHFCPPYPEMYPATPPRMSCSVCGRSGGPLAVLEPCQHPLCSACLTSALNIVGEKDMECAVCKLSVNNFELQANSDDGNSRSTVSQHASGSFSTLEATASPFPERFVRDDYTLLPSAFDPRPLPSLMSKMSLYTNQTLEPSPSSFAPTASQVQRGENIVLRIDNVPWDITPPAIVAWMKHPVVRVHVLLDQRGKTLSHAYVEIAIEEVARAALREVQNSVLGKGKRARGVTVTRSSQEELMRALFPSWKGKFDGSRPSLTGLNNEQLAMALSAGLITNMELDALMHLVRSPDSHFLKVPSLPFHSLISILSKFPVDLDSRVFWTSEIRDALFNLTHNSLDVLVARFRENASQAEPELLGNLLNASVNCRAFTDQQIDMLKTIETACSSALAPTFNPYYARDAPVMHDFTSRGSSYSLLAREFGVNEELVQALAQRLGNFR